MQDQDCLIWIFLGWNSKMSLDCGILHQHPQIFLNAKFQTKIKILKFGTKTALIGYFRLEFQKLMSSWKSVSSNLLTCKVSSKNKETLDLGPKISYLGIFGLQFIKNYYQIFNQHPRICEKIKFHPKQKKIFLGPKMLYLGLWTRILENYCHICNQRPPIYLMAKFPTKTRILNLMPKMPYLGVLGRNFKKPLSYLKSAPSNLPYCKHWCKK